MNKINKCNEKGKEEGLTWEDPDEKNEEKSEEGEDGENVGLREEARNVIG